MPYSVNVAMMLFSSAETMLRTLGFAPFEINHRINDQLPGSVIGNLPAPVDLDDGNVVADQQVFGFAYQPPV